MNALQRRLQIYKERATKYNKPWQDLRFEKYHQIDTPTYNKGKMYLDNISIGEDLGPCHELNRNIKHTGWYCNQYQNGTIVGHVIKLRCSKGTLYIPVTVCSEWDGITYYLSDRYLIEKAKDNENEHNEAIKDCAYRADRLAEIEAEESREVYENEDNKQKLYNLIEDNRTLFADIEKLRSLGVFENRIIDHGYETIKENKQKIIKLENLINWSK